MPEGRVPSLIEEIKQVIDITSRVDERVKIIAESQQQINLRLNHFIDEHNALTSRVHVLESKNGGKVHEQMCAQDERALRMMARIEALETVGSPRQQQINEDSRLIKLRIEELEKQKRSMYDRLKIVGGYVWQGVFTILICYLLYKMGISSSPVP